MIDRLIQLFSNVKFEGEGDDKPEGSVMVRLTKTLVEVIAQDLEEVKRDIARQGELRISMEGKIDRQRTELANLRKKRVRVVVTELAALKREMESYRDDHKKIDGPKQDIRSLVEDNERLKRENAELRARMAGGGFWD